MFSASDIKDLRDKTGAGMLDCKKALQETAGDIDKAIDWLREKGISKAAKKESRIAAEGLCLTLSQGNNAVMVEVNCETDFVAKNEEFQNFVKMIATEILKHDELSTNDDVLSLVVDNESIGDKLVALTAKIGEKLSFRRFVKLTKEDNQVFGEYLHMGGKIGTIVVLEGANTEVAKDVAMQTAAMNPTCVSREDVPQDLLEHESNIIREQVINEGKPAEIAEKMVAGRLNKFYKEICLDEQVFVKDSSLSVGNYVKNNGGKIIKMVRFAVGEGIEKKQEDFASEVMKQING